MYISLQIDQRTDRPLRSLLSKSINTRNICLLSGVCVKTAHAPFFVLTKIQIECMLYNKDYEREIIMPPKAKITKEMIVDTAFEIVQKEGVDKVTARSISEQLKCSTQPVLYYFSTVEDIKKMVYIKADEYHANYILNTEIDYGNPMLAIGMNYIKFAIEERNLFRFLFQSNELSGVGMLDWLESEELLPMLAVLQKELGMSMEDTKEVFSMLFIFVHGYASLYANNTMIYDEPNIMKALEKIFYGAVCATKGE